MRQIGTLTDRGDAERFQDYLIGQGISCSLDDEADGVAIWVHDDDQIAGAKAEFAAFRLDPAAAKYREARAQADAVLQAAAAIRKAARRNTVALSREWSRSAGAALPVTLLILILCVLVLVDDMLMGRGKETRELLFFSTDGTWGAIRGGEYWRIVSPAIMHGGVLHIFFNLMWWWQLGGLIESRKGSAQLLAMTLVIAAGSNILQFQLGGPWFLGLSGVVFGVFGYVWVKGYLDPQDGIGIPRDSAIMMLIWFVVCCLGLVGRIANWAHAGGLILGVTWGAVSAAWRLSRRRG
jgi:GlpG protein